MLKSHKTGHPSRPANFFGPSASRFREVYYAIHDVYWGILWYLGLLFILLVFSLLNNRFMFVFI